MATALNGAIGYDKGTAIVKRATATGRPLREVALEEGVDAKLYDETIDLRTDRAGQPALTPSARRLVRSAARAVSPRAPRTGGAPPRPPAWRARNR